MNGLDLDGYLVCNEWFNWIRTLGADGAQGENTGFKGARQEGKSEGEEAGQGEPWQGGFVGRDGGAGKWGLGLVCSFQLNAAKFIDPAQVSCYC